MFKVGRVTVTGHKWSYENFVGGVPVGRELDHTCHNGSGCVGGPTCVHRRCVNPWHVEPVKHLENYRRGNLGQAVVEMTHCKRGHLFDETRRCRECIRQADAVRRQSPEYKAVVQRRLFANREKIQARQKRWYADNRDKQLAYAKRRYAEKKSRAEAV
jgi:hypothetical protein